MSKGPNPDEGLGSEIIMCPCELKEGIYGVTYDHKEASPWQVYKGKDQMKRNLPILVLPVDKP